MNRKAATNTGKAAADEIEVHHDQTIAVPVGCQADHVLRPNVGNDQRHAHRPPGECLAGQEIIAAGPNAARPPESQGSDPQQVGGYQCHIQRCQACRFHRDALTAQKRKTSTIPFTGSAGDRWLVRWVNEVRSYRDCSRRQVPPRGSSSVHKIWTATRKPPQARTPVEARPMGERD